VKIVFANTNKPYQVKTSSIKMNRNKTSKATELMSSFTAFTYKSIKGFWQKEIYLVSSKDGASIYLAYDNNQKQWFLNERHFPIAGWMQPKDFAKIVSEDDFNQIISESV
jgi:hypothetical protein